MPNLQANEADEFPNETHPRQLENNSGTNLGNRSANVSTPRTKKNAPAGESQIQRPRKNEKLIRLDDLIPKGNVSGGGRLIFGEAHINQATNKRKR